MTEFKEFKISDIFSEPEKGDVDLQESDVNGKGDYLINSGKTNLGIKGKTDKKAKIFEPNTITIDFWGNAYYRDYKYKLATHNHVFSFNDDIIKNKEVGLYLTGALRFLDQKYSYSNMLTWKKLKKEKIILPIISGTNQIDFQYMEDEVKKLEHHQINLLDEYLIVNKLNDFQLTSEDKEILNVNPTYKNFMIKDLFKKVKLKRKKKKWDKKKDTSTIPNSEFDLPLINAKAGNNGIMYYGRSEDWESADMSIDIIQNGAIATGLVYAQPQATGQMWDAYLIHYIPQRLNKEQLLYFATVIEKAIQPKYNYEHKATWTRVQNESIQLPVDKLENIDLSYMEKYIKAIQKMVVKDSVKYIDSKTTNENKK